jgi:hypothetical protein
MEQLTTEWLKANSQQPIAQYKAAKAELKK